MQAQSKSTGNATKSNAIEIRTHLVVEEVEDGALGRARHDLVVRRVTVLGLAEAAARPPRLQREPWLRRRHWHRACCAIRSMRISFVALGCSGADAYHVRHSVCLSPRNEVIVAQLLLLPSFCLAWVSRVARLLLCWCCGSPRKFRMDGDWGFHICIPTRNATSACLEMALNDGTQAREQEECLQLVTKPFM